MAIDDSTWEEGTAVGMSPWDIPTEVNGGPRRGGPNDYGQPNDGPAFEDEAGSEPPKDGTQLYADMMAAIQCAAISADKVHFAVAFTVTLDGGGAPVLSKITGPGKVCSIDNIGTIFTLSDPTPGDVTINWPAGTLPTPILEPGATLNDALLGSAAMGGGISAQMLSTGLGVRVLTWDGSNVGTARAFTVRVW